MTTIPLLAPAALLACVLARRVPSPRQRVIAATMTALLAINVVRPMLARGSLPDVAAFALWYAVTAGPVWSVLGVRRGDERADQAPEKNRDGGHVVVRSREGPEHPERHQGDGGGVHFRHVWIMLTACAVASPIAYRCGVDVSRVAFALALAAQALAVLRFAARGVKPDDAQRVALILAASSLADAVALWSVGNPWRDWYVGRAISLATWALIAAVQIRWLLRGRVVDREG